MELQPTRPIIPNIMVFIAAAIAALLHQRAPSMLMNIDPFRGVRFTYELLNGHPVRMRDMTHMSTGTFHQLVLWLRNNTGVGDSGSLPMEERVMIFLFIIV